MYSLCGEPYWLNGPITEEVGLKFSLEQCTIESKNIVTKIYI